jgi:hypothetical protein
MQRKCPYCTISFKDEDLVYAFHHENPRSFHLIHVACLNGSKGEIVATEGVSVGKCPSCNEESTYMGKDPYIDFVRLATPYLDQDVDVVVANSKPVTVYEIGEGVDIKKRRTNKQSKKYKNKSKNKSNKYKSKK